MASALTPFGREWLLRLAFRKEDAVGVSVQCALTRTVPDATGTLSSLDEPTSTVNYFRKTLNLGVNDWLINSAGVVNYSKELLWNPPFGDWGSLQGWALIGNNKLVAVGAMTLPRRIGVGTRARIPAHAIRVGLFDA